MTSNIKVVDVNEEAKQDTPEVKTEEAVQQVEETQNEVVNEVIKEPVIEPVIEKKEELPKPEATPKPQTLQDKVRCPKCYREMTIKAFKYRHEKACQGKLSEDPVKPHTKPKSKPQPKPEPTEIQTPTQSSINPTQSSINPPPSEKPTPQPIHQINSLMSHYQLLQQQYIQQKQERFNNLFQGMVSGSRKKR